MAPAFRVTMQQPTNKLTNKQSGHWARQEAKKRREDRGEAVSSHDVWSLTHTLIIFRQIQSE